MTDINTSPVVACLRENGWYALFEHVDGDPAILPVHALNVQADGTHVALVMDENLGHTPVTEVPGLVFRHFIGADDAKALEELPEMVTAVNPAFAR
ncbi:hypothetical protein [Streptomyces virginiae]